MSDQAKSTRLVFPDAGRFTHGKSVAFGHPMESGLKGRVKRVLSIVACLALLGLSLGMCGCSLIGPLVGAAAPYAGIKMYFACIPEHTLVDTPIGRRPIETLQPGDSVVGYSGDSVRILQKHA